MADGIFPKNFFASHTQCVWCVSLCSHSQCYLFTMLFGRVSVKLTKNTYSFAIWFDESLSLHRARIRWLSTEWFKSFLRKRETCVRALCVFVLCVCVLATRTTKLPFGQFIFLDSINVLSFCFVWIYPEDYREKKKRKKIPKHFEMKTTCSTNFT